MIKIENGVCDIHSEDPSDLILDMVYAVAAIRFVIDDLEKKDVIEKKESLINDLHDLIDGTPVSEVFDRKERENTGVMIIGNNKEMVEKIASILRKGKD